MQQSVALSRMSAAEDCLQRLRRSLGRRKLDGSFRPRRSQILLWQVPVMMLNVSILLLALGLFIVAWGGTEDHRVSRSSAVLEST